MPTDHQTHQTLARLVRGYPDGFCASIILHLYPMQQNDTRSKGRCEGLIEGETCVRVCVCANVCVCVRACAYVYVHVRLGLGTTFC